MSKNALQSKLEKKTNTVDVKGINKDIDNVKAMVQDIEANVKRSVVQQLKMLDGQIDEKLQAIVKPFNSRIDQLEESIFAL